MNRKIWISVIVLIILFLVGGAYYSDKKAEKIDYSADRQKAIDEILNQPTITIFAKHQFKNGEHTFLGTLEIPNPCYLYDAEVKKSAEVTEIALSYKLDPAKSADVCAEVITEKTFKVKFEGTEDENIVMTLNGEIVKLNQFEIDPEENIEDADIFIKG